MLEFKNKEAEAAARGYAKSKGKFSQLRSIGAYQSAAVSLAMAFPDDKAAIYEAFGMTERESARPLIKNPVQAVGRSQAAMQKSAQKSGVPCPTCGKKKASPVIQNPVSAVKAKAKQPEPAPVVEEKDEKLLKEIDALVGDMGLEKLEKGGSPAEVQEIEEALKQKKKTDPEEIDERQKAIDELADLQNHDLSKPAPQVKAKTREDAEKEEKAKRPRKPRTPKTEK